LKEQELFDWLKSEHYSDLEHSPNEFDAFDCTTHEHKMFIELKSRKTFYPSLLIEKIKFDFLIEQARLLQYEPYYINYTPEGVYSFHLNNIGEIDWAEKWLPSTTEFANKNNKMKLVGFISIDVGIKL
jgi:hypothetical protein